MQRLRPIKIIATFFAKPSRCVLKLYRFWYPRRRTFESQVIVSCRFGGRKLYGESRRTNLFLRNDGEYAEHLLPARVSTTFAEVDEDLLSAFYVS